MVDMLSDADPFVVNTRSSGGRAAVLSQRERLHKGMGEKTSARRRQKAGLPPAGLPGFAQIGDSQPEADQGFYRTRVHVTRFSVQKIGKSTPGHPHSVTHLQGGRLDLPSKDFVPPGFCMVGALVQR